MGWDSPFQSGVRVSTRRLAWIGTNFISPNLLFNPFMSYCIRALCNSWSSRLCSSYYNVRVFEDLGRSCSTGCDCASLSGTCSRHTIWRLDVLLESAYLWWWTCSKLRTWVASLAAILGWWDRCAPCAFRVPSRCCMWERYHNLIWK